MTTSKTGKTGKTGNKSTSQPKRRTQRRANPIDDALARLERDIPKLLRQLRTNVQDLQSQVDRARADGEQRWRDAERKIKNDATQLRQNLEKRFGGVVGRIRAKGTAAKAAKSAKASKPRKSPRKRSA